MTVQQLEPLRTEQQSKRGGHKPNAAKAGQKISQPRGVLKAEIKQEKAEQIREGKNWYQHGWWNSFLCDLKIGDFFVAFFTLSLVVVGYFTMRSADNNMKRAERAYVLGGGPYGLVNDEKTAKDIREGLTWAEAKYFKDPKRMTIQNYGKTAGFVTKVEWGLVKPAEYPGFKNLSQPGSAVSKAIRTLRKRVMSKELPVRAYRKVKHPVEVFQPTGGGVLFYRHVHFPRKRYVGHIFYGRIEYTDVFGDSHHSTFRLYLNHRYSQPLGDSYQKDAS